MRAGVPATRRTNRWVCVATPDKRCRKFRLGRQERPHGPAEAEQRRLAGVAEAALDHVQVKPGDQLDAEPLVVRAADHLDDREPAGDPDLALHQRAHADRVGGDHQPARHVVAAQVFVARQLDERF
jgi:hypothetical protein